MDILKILSRGTKKSATQPTIPKPVVKPSNPQLYNDPTRGLKRKRNEEQPSSNQEADDDLEEINFFAPHIAKKPIPEPETRETSKEDASKPLLDDEEVRQVLRSHRLKFTLLSSHERKKSKVKKSKKKEEDKPKEKDGKKQLFPQPMTSFSELRSNYNISTRLGDNLAKQGYRIPTEVQLGSLPLLLQPERAIASSTAKESNFKTKHGVDFLAVAPTGSGKTLAFLIPAINSILRRRAGDAAQKDHILEVVVVAPTRELAHQIVNEGRKLAQGTGVKIVGMKRGMQLPAEGQPDSDSDKEEEGSENDQEAGSSDDDDGDDAEDDKQDNKPQKATTITKTDILVTTPMLLRNFLKSRKLPTVKHLVLDEADVLLDPLFREQTLGIWTACTSDSLRVACWSATMGSNIEGLILEQLKSRESHSSIPLIRLVVGLKDTAVPSINHKLIYTATEQGKLFALRQLLHPSSSDDSMPNMRLPFLVFAQTIDRATALHNELKFDIPVEAGGSSRIAALHSSLSDSARSSIVARFRAGEIWVLITTDLLMRGIDFRGVNGVINYDVPTSAAAYVHRVGRTGRAGHEGGVAVTFYTTEDVAYLKSIANVISLSEKQAGKASEEGIPKWLMDSLPKVGKEEKKKLKKRGVESRRGDKAKITTQSAWERRKENNKRGAIAGSKKRKIQEGVSDTQAVEDGEWGGIDD
ncbi:P-loop containing nucleoside triphosphate hydrolase protein [Annulohypoxylon maeteangense]|uniref:P-loop containing nucleoside triphosphate hydrolase protein n=1 Tax=Annulohypoxylon maeteangense TaxID=1927788 RepID=UPI0020073F5F|nr:P-loop containing nucleoside triphosphate hydrolase protein [Annulohypoxylon maeteangense]KAI0881485.1 P-loop containing nucleoside triphosphate hydrolase protein [Annulohypoxylon maeteangense]